MSIQNKYKVKEQLTLFKTEAKQRHKKSYLENLQELLHGNLDFHGNGLYHSLHNFHSFPAKFPPHLPQLFISELTEPGQIVLDPMVGSGTTILEAYLANRKAIGFDIDPLALKLSIVKTTHYNRKLLLEYGRQIFTESKKELKNNRAQLEKRFRRTYDVKTLHFIDFWFFPDIQLELFALLEQIKFIHEYEIRNFFEIIFSSLIITKSGGVSLAHDLGHTRPHKTKILLDENGKVIYGEDLIRFSKKNTLKKTIKSPLLEFEKRVHQITNKLNLPSSSNISPEIRYCDSQNLDLADESVDLIVTSPPYASNAIDYMRAHKFSLVWLGYEIEELTIKRNDYIGSESTNDFQFETLPAYTRKKVLELMSIDEKRGKVLERYFSEMSRTIKEMFRIIKPNKSVIVVVGSSILKGVDIETHKCLAEIGKNYGFDIPGIGVRKLDRNKRMMPTGKRADLNSQIQKRMHQEYIIGFYKS